MAISGGACSASSGHLIRDEVQVTLCGTIRHVKSRGVPPYPHLLFGRILERPQNKSAVFRGGKDGIMTSLAILVFAVLKPHVRLMPE